MLFILQTKIMNNSVLNDPLDIHEQENLDATLDTAGTSSSTGRV